MIDQIKNSSPINIYSMVYIKNVEDEWNIAHPKPIERLDVQALIKDVAFALHIEVEQMYVKTRKTRIKFARWLVWKVMKSYKFSFRECGETFARERFRGYDHSTVLNALNNIDRDIEETAYLQDAYHHIEKYMNKEIKKAA